jgi:hypothetical protein
MCSTLNGSALLVIRFVAYSLSAVPFARREAAASSAPSMPKTPPAKFNDSNKKPLPGGVECLSANTRTRPFMKLDKDYPET